MLSVWNNYQFTPRLGAGVGLIRSARRFAAIDDTVTLPGYTRADAALFVAVGPTLRLQANVENITSTTYVVDADGNNNISPGSPRAVRIAVTKRF